MRITTYYHTLRYLKPCQIWGRVLHKLKTVKVKPFPHPELHEKNNTWQTSIAKLVSMQDEKTFCFLNTTHSINTATDWNNSIWSKLWLYNLHYFDDLNAKQNIQRCAWHESLIACWIKENPIGHGNGWEPYTLSLRIVNWIKWQLSGTMLSEQALDSLAIQTQFLTQRLETHLLGNHLLANAKALLFAGCFFAGKQAKQWLQIGWKIFNEQLQEQILADGGHFELSPMYHAIILEDLLDVINLFQTYQQIVPEDWLVKASHMLDWLQTMLHPDGQIALFNDAAFAIAAEYADLQAYAERLNIKPSTQIKNFLPNSGYARLQNAKACVLADVAAIGPDYLPGHAHADTLSVEFSLGQQRVIVHSGTSTYENNAERLRQRSTAAHNTLVIDEQNSSQVWASFRVAQRARVKNIEWRENAAEIFLSAQHNGYKRLPGQIIHQRSWQLTQDELLITDNVTGNGKHNLAFFLHLHPDIFIEKKANSVFELLDKSGKRVAEIKLDQKLMHAIVSSTYHPEFGKVINNQKIISTIECELPFATTIKINF